MSNKRLCLVLACLFSFIVVLPVCAGQPKIKGDPEIVWLSPLGSSDIENNQYNRCLLIRKIKPGKGETSTANKNTHDILSSYAANLYAQSIKIGGYIEEEKEKTDSSEPDLSDEKALLDEEITKRLGNIAHRINIINSFEAGTMILESLNAMIQLSPEAYSEFRVLKNGKVEYSSDCEDLK